MATGCMIVAEAGSGKSTSIENLNEKETFIINVSGKPLPFRGWRTRYKAWHPTDNKEGNYYETSDPKAVVRLMEKIDSDLPHIKNIIVDDYQYLSSFEYMNRSDEKGFEKFTSIAKNMFLTATKPKALRDDLIVFYLTHVETDTDINGVKRQKAKTVGKMIDSTITLEGLFTVVLFGKVKKGKEGVEHVFETKNNGENTCKAPKGMFDAPEIPNDLEIVRKAILEYNN
jgi:hypothetical protein